MYGVVWVVFDRSQSWSGLGLTFGLRWAFGVTGQVWVGFSLFWVRFKLGPVRFRLI